MSYLDERTELTFIRIIIDVLVFGVTVKFRYRFLSLDKRRLVHVREKNFIRKDEILTVRSWLYNDMKRKGCALVTYMVHQLHVETTPHLCVGVCLYLEYSLLPEYSWRHSEALEGVQVALVAGEYRLLRFSYCNHL